MRALRPPFAYYGGKTRMANNIISLIPTDAKAYVEPFAGSLAVLLGKEPHGIEVVNDLDARLVAFWRTVRDRPSEIRWQLAATPYSRDEFNHALETIDTEAGEIEFARKVFVILRQSRKRSTSAVPGNFRGSGDSRGPANTFTASVNTLPDVAERLRGVVIENMDALALIDRWDKPDTAMYLDPPYVGETRTARDYTIENAGTEFHETLVDRIAASEARIVISGYGHAAYDPLRDWNRHTFQSQTGADSKVGKFATEVIWTNF